MPLVWAANPDVRLSLIGANPNERVIALAGERVEITGYVSDAELVRRYSKARGAVIPLRFGAGVKSKVVEALQQGVPLITTSVGAQGLPGLEMHAAIVDEPGRTAAAILRVVGDDDLWSTQSRGGAEYARGSFSPHAMSSVLLSALGIRAPRGEE